MKKIVACIAIINIHCLQSSAQNELNIVPLPVETKVKEADWTKDKYPVIYSSSVIVAKSPVEKKVAQQLKDYLKTDLGYQLKIGSSVSKTKSSIVLKIDSKCKYNNGYILKSAGKLVTITGNDGTGLFYGIQTLRQLLFNQFPVATPANMGRAMPLLEITDYPRFQYRGMHLDVSRHFASVEFVKKYIDYLAFHKFNNFHWHLTDDQGWRIEIKKYPLLTKIGGYRAQTLAGRYGSDVYDGKPYGGFYTQEEVKEVVRYATERHINVVPEIEMPGHALAALAAYPNLGCTKGPYKAAETWGVFDDVFCAGTDTTFIFLQNVLDEVIALFPSKLIHIGGDECPKVRWKACPDCQARMKKENLKDEHELQSYFIQRMEKYLNKKGRNIIGWDEILEGGLAPNATVMSWRGEEGGITAAKQHHNVIMTPTAWMYFDYSQSSNEDSVVIGGFVPLEKVYSYDPVPATLDSSLAKYILGGQANVWREYMNNDKKTEYMIFPRMSALSEVLWSPKSKRNWEDFERRLPAIFERYKSWGANYSNAYYDLQSKVVPLPGNGIGWELKSKKKEGKIIYSILQKDKTYSQPSVLTNDLNSRGLFVVTDNMTVKAALSDEKDQPVSNWILQDFHMNKASGKPVTLAEQPSKGYAGSGGFTLVDGVQNNMGMNKSAQFLGFSGSDLEATVDLGTVQSVSNIILHAFEQSGSWIYRPQFVVFYISEDGTNYYLLDTSINLEEKKNLLYSSNKTTRARFIKVIAKNAGVIPTGKPGAGSKAWLFVDELEVF